MAISKNEKKTVTKTLTISYSIQAKRTALSAVFAILITLIVNWEAIVPFLPQRQVPSLCLTLEEQLPTYGQNEIDRLIELRRYVPDYDAHIYVSLKSEKASAGSYIQFTVKVVDNGIIKLQNPYFYSFLLNSEGEVVSSFPSMGHISTWDKMSSWNTRDHQNDFYTDCLQIESEGNSYYVPRKTLIDSYGKYVYVRAGNLYWCENPSEIILQFYMKDDPSLIGRWQIFVILYDGSYVDRFGEILDSNNFVSFQSTIFDVTSKTEPSPSPTSGDIFRLVFSFAAFIATFSLTYFGIYSELEKNKEKLNKAWIKIKEHAIFFASIIIIILLFVAYILWLK